MEAYRESFGAVVNNIIKTKEKTRDQLEVCSVLRSFCQAEFEKVDNGDDDSRVKSTWNRHDIPLPFLHLLFYEDSNKQNPSPAHARKSKTLVACAVLDEAITRLQAELMDLHLGTLSHDLVVNIFSWLDPISLVMVSETALSWSHLNGHIVEDAALVTLHALQATALLTDIRHAAALIISARGLGLFHKQNGITCRPGFKLSMPKLSALLFYMKCLPSRSNTTTFSARSFALFEALQSHFNVIDVTVGSQFNDPRFNMYAPGPELNVPNCSYRSDFVLGPGSFFLVIDSGFNSYHGRMEVLLDGKNVLVGDDGQLIPRIWVSSPMDTTQADAMAMGCLDQYYPTVAGYGIFAIPIRIQQVSLRYSVTISIPAHKNSQSLGNYICIQGVSFIPMSFVNGICEICSDKLPGNDRYRQNGRSLHRRHRSVRQTRRPAHMHYLLYEDGHVGTVDDVRDCGVV